MPTMQRWWLALLGLSVTSGKQVTIFSGQDLAEAVIWKRTDQSGCVRLLNTSHETGCASDGPIQAPLLRVDGDLPVSFEGPAVLVANASALPALLAAVAAVPDERIAGITVVRDQAAGGNLEDRSPEAAFDPAGRRHEWNPGGHGLLQRRWGFPIQGLDDASAARALAGAAENKGTLTARHYARLESSMLGTESSPKCLASGNCDPLGGHSVWASFAGNTRAEALTLPITLVAAQADGIGFFHSEITGADAPLSSLVAVLAAAEAIGTAAGAATLRTRLVFAVFAGEPWGYMGSKRFLWELSRGSNATEGLRTADIAHVIEVGQVGRAATSESGGQQLFFHGEPGPGFGSSAAIWEAFQESTAGTTASLAKATGGAGLPPSSLTSFLRANASVAGAVLAEFDGSFTNPGYATAADTLDGINRAGVTAAAILLARALLRLSTGSASLQVNTSRVNDTVNELLDCFAAPGAILACQRAERLIARTGMPSNYVGVLHTLTADTQDPDVNVKNDMSRFLWNFLAEATSTGEAKLVSGEAGGCDLESKLCEPGAACVGFRVDRPAPEGSGRCLFATARFVPAYSTSIECEGCTGEAWGKWVPSTAAAAWERELGWPEDPNWTESRWSPGIPTVELFLREDPRRERAVLAAGLVATALTVLVSQVARMLHARRVEQS